MTSEKPKRWYSNYKSTDQEFIRADTAMRRAAYVAQKRAIATTGSYEVW